LRILREPSEELAEPLGSAEPRLKNTGLDDSYRRQLRRFKSFLSYIYLPRIDILELSDNFKVKFQKNDEHYHGIKLFGRIFLEVHKSIFRRKSFIQFSFG